MQQLDDAELIAWGAYQAGRYQDAQEWLALAEPDRPFTLWIKAKLMMRQGNLEHAAKILTQALAVLPQDHWPASNPQMSTGEEDGLTFCPSARAAGELAKIQIARNDFIDALATLIKGTHWPDVAYVAERLLTLDELKAFVDQHYPTVDWPSAIQSGLELPRLSFAPLRNVALLEGIPLTLLKSKGDFISYDGDKWTTKATQLHYLLARRLARQQRWQEATQYYPTDMRELVKQYIALLQANADAKPMQKADQLWKAAQILRTHGMELIGTELEPDWAMFGGNFWMSDPAAARKEAFPSMTAQEQQRSQRTRVSIEERYHYRYLAAELAWQAAELLPKQNEQAAFILTSAGNWLKYVNPRRADKFYKALVNQHGMTSVGLQAQTIHWLPDLNPVTDP